MTNTPSTEERVWASLSHLSALAFGLGLLLPVIGWSEQRRKSRYASFQCLQALGYQSLGYTLWLLGFLVLMIVFVLGMAVLTTIAGTSAGRTGTLAGMGMSIMIAVFFLGGFALYFILPLIAAVSCALGRDFRYPAMGSRLARYLGYDPAKANGEPADLIEDHEDRWVSAMGHISVIIALWGMLGPLTAWILQGRRSAFLKFQSVQTLAYQALVNMLSMSSGVIYMSGFITFLLLTGFEMGMENGSRTSIIGIVILLLSMLVVFLIFLLIPLFHILGQWAGYRVLKGDDFRYPFVGKVIERWMLPRPAGSQSQLEQ